METIASAPIQDSLIETNEQIPSRRDPFYIAKGWINWIFQSLIPRVEAAPQVLKVVDLTAQAAAIPATPIPLPVLAAGQYRVSWYVQITTPASIASATQITIGWTFNGVAQSFVGTLVNGNLTTSYESDELFLSIDRATAITYAASYVSAGTPMDFAFSLACEQVN